MSTATQPQLPTSTSWITPIGKSLQTKQGVGVILIALAAVLSLGIFFLALAHQMHFLKAIDSCVQSIGSKWV